MPLTSSDRRQNLRLRETQMEIPQDTYAPAEDYDGKLADAQTQLERLQAQREELERQRNALEELNLRKQDFINSQLDLSERLNTALTSLERELYLSKQEIEDLEQTRKALVNHLQKIDSLHPESWPQGSVESELQQAFVTMDKAEEEYDQAVSYFRGTRKGNVFGGPTSGGRSRLAGGEFRSALINGFAFNLPVILLGTIALVIYLLNSGILGQVLTTTR